MSSSLKYVTLDSLVLPNSPEYHKIEKLKFKRPNLTIFRTSCKDNYFERIDENNNIYKYFIPSSIQFLLINNQVYKPINNIYSPYGEYTKSIRQNINKYITKELTKQNLLNIKIGYTWNDFTSAPISSIAPIRLYIDNDLAMPNYIMSCNKQEIFSDSVKFYTLVNQFNWVEIPKSKLIFLFVKEKTFVFFPFSPSTIIKISRLFNKISDHIYIKLDKNCITRVTFPYANFHSNPKQYKINPNTKLSLQINK